MLDLGFVRDNLAVVEEKLRQRGMDPAEVLKDFREVDARRRQAITDAETLKARRNRASEEIARLKIHSRQLDELLSEGGEVGKKLDFLLQEMNRETNTILSKTSGIGESGLGITDLALAAKADIEKIREQSLNLE